MAGRASVPSAGCAGAIAGSSRAAFQRAGSRLEGSRRRIRPARLGNTSRRYSIGLTSARRQHARIVYAMAAPSPLTNSRLPLLSKREPHREQRVARANAGDALASPAYLPESDRKSAEVKGRRRRRALASLPFASAARSLPRPKVDYFCRARQDYFSRAAKAARSPPVSEPAKR